MSVEVPEGDKILAEYVMDQIGAPFTVVLVDSVRQAINPTSGEVETYIPDQRNLLKVIAATRAADPRKLNGNDIKFLRKSLGMRAIELAAKLDVSAEHISRCESGIKALSNGSEKILRLHVLLEPFNVSDMAVENASEEMKRIVSQKVHRMDEVHRVLNEMKLVVVSVLDDPIVYRFSHVRRPTVNFFDVTTAANDDEREWIRRVC